MKKVKKIKIRANGKTKFIPENYNMSDLIKVLDVHLKKVAIELNREIINKNNINKIYLKKKDNIEIVHFIGGG